MLSYVVEMSSGVPADKIYGRNWWPANKQIVACRIVQKKLLFIQKGAQNQKFIAKSLGKRTT